MLDTLEEKILGNKKALEDLNQAKELLKQPLVDLDLFNVIIEDSTQLRELWQELKTVMGPLDELYEIPFQMMIPVKV